MEGSQGSDEEARDLDAKATRIHVQDAQTGKAFPLNARTAKLIRRFCVAKGVDYKRTKHYWNKFPRTERDAARISMHEELIKKSFSDYMPIKTGMPMISVR